jgi:hypothetical protein
LVKSGGKVVAVDALAADGDGRVFNLFVGHDIYD